VRSAERSLAILSVSLLVWSGEAAAGALRAEVEVMLQRNVGEYLELLRLPNVSAQAADIVRNARFLRTALERRGFAVQLLDNPAGRPVVLAQAAAADPTKPTVLFYAHYDGQPVIAAEWSQADPFEPVVRRRSGTDEWEDVGEKALVAQPLDHELRVFARSAADDKAPIMMLLTALDLLRGASREPAFNVKVLLDGEEEIGSPGLAGVIGADRAAFRADALVILDGPLHDSGRPTLVFGNRGLAQATLTVYGPRSPLHSGHYGNYVPNPALRLAALLATFKDEDGRVSIPGYYDGIELSAEDRAVLAAVGDDEQALQRRAGIARPERVGATYQESLQYPSLNVRGMAAAGIGASAANIVPSQATAEIDLRTTPEADGRRLFDLVRQHIARQGYRVLSGPPSDEDRAEYDKLASFVLNAAQAAARMPLDSDIGAWALSALASPNAPSPEIPPVRIRMMGGTVPTDVLVAALPVPFLLVPTVNADNNQHARDENLRVGNLVTGTETLYSLLTTPYTSVQR
jgi:acetylornithine deacetylase/succinyl-diaminopimelate desuccinylase-like protein